VVHRLVDAPPVGIEDPVAGARCTAYRDGIHRLVRAASGAGTGRDAETRVRVHGVEHLDGRPLDDCVVQRRLAEGSLATIGVRDVDALDRWSLVASPLPAV
jgi:hypothetical protein